MLRYEMVAGCCHFWLRSSTVARAFISVSAMLDTASALPEASWLVEVIALMRTVSCCWKASAAEPGTGGQSRARASASAWSWMRQESSRSYVRFHTSA